MPAINVGMPYTRDENWTKAAACTSHDPELWFAGEGSLGRFRAERAKDICIKDCPVRLECLTEHIGEEFGIFGGLDEKERKKLRG